MSTEPTITQVNSNFTIRVIDSFGKSRLTGAGQLHKIIGNDGDRLSKKMFKEAFENGTDKYSLKLRRGIRVDFYSK